MTEETDKKISELKVHLIAFSWAFNHISQRMEFSKKASMRTLTWDIFCVLECFTSHIHQVRWHCLYWRVEKHTCIGIGVIFDLTVNILYAYLVLTKHVNDSSDTIVKLLKTAVSTHSSVLSRDHTTQLYTGWIQSAVVTKKENSSFYWSSIFHKVNMYATILD